MGTNTNGINNKQNNYFTSMIAKYGGKEDFVAFLKPEQIQRSAKERIFREMARGQIDYGQFGKHYLDGKFLENLIVAANNELVNSQVIVQALYWYDLYVSVGDLNVARVRTRQQNLAFIYECIYTRLCQVKMTGDIGYLTEIQFILKEPAKNM